MSKRRAAGTGSIYRRPDGYWCGVISKGFSAQGKRLRTFVYGKTRTEVLDKIRDAAFAKGSLGDFFDDWLKRSKPDYRTSTYKLYEGLVNRYIKPRIGALKLSELDKPRLQRYYSDLIDAKVTPRRRQQVHIVLHRALEDAVSDDLLSRNPVDKVKRPKWVAKPHKTYTAEQARLLLKHAKADPYYALFVLALTTALRQGELFGLRRQDVNLKDGFVSVRIGIQANGGHPIADETKTDTSRRRVDLPAIAIRALQAHVKRVSGVYLFQHEGGLMQKDHFVRQHYDKVVKAAGLPRIKFHELRHTVATLLFQQQEHPKVVQEMLGHASIKTTLDMYSHVIPTMQKEAALKMNSLLGGKSVGRRSRPEKTKNPQSL